ncbi:fumarate reductase subunit FrdD [Ectothiorhodospira mobilis]|uniref:fumarate reductase subunit FrdD n=1 Tax=Ectothiorhodospira mobilis TaxID=195064 RepID=UPI001908292D|nr:fumarate reductase subunit FrdD [Ectothiorhodospira mobilis]MBK1691994.1 hypothetical protein [Ectothiorhodospira mobilis]
MRPRNLEPLFWTLFGAGGMLAALVGPALVLILALPFPPGALEYATLRGAMTHPLVALGLGVTVGLWLFHAAHRILHTLYDLGVPHAQWLPRVCYGGAAAGALAALGVALAWVLQ